MLRATTSRRGLLGKDYDISADGRSVASWAVKTWEKRRDLTIDGTPCVLLADRTTWFQLDGGYPARADRAKAGTLSRPHWDITVGDQRFRLNGSGTGKRFSLVATGTGEQVGSVWRSNGMTPACTAELPDALPVPVQVFVLWVAMTIWRTTAVSITMAGAGASG